MTNKDFELGDVLTITTGKLVSKRMMDGVYDILNYMTGCNLYTHQLPEASNKCRPYLLQQHPQLKSIDSDIVSKDNVWQWLDEQIKVYGEKLPVNPIDI